MKTRQPRRNRRTRFAVAVVVMFAVTAAIGCNGRSNEVADGAAIPVAADAATAGADVAELVELQRALPTGHEGVWYTQRLTELGFRIESLRREDDGAVAYRIVRGADAFDLRVGIDQRSGLGQSVQIVPVLEPGVAVAANEAGDVPASDAAVADNDGDRATATPTPKSARTATEAGEAGAKLGPGRDAPDRTAQPTPVENPTTNGTPDEPDDNVYGAESDAAVVPGPPAPTTPAPAPAPPPEPRRYVVTVPAGTRVATMLDERLGSADAEVGDAFSMTVAEAIWADGFEVLPAGSRVWGYVAEVERAGRPNKGGRIVLAAERAEVGNDELILDALVSADQGRLEGRDSAREDAKEVAIGAGLGGLVGGLLGGKKGVLVGVLAGGGGTFVATKGEEVELEAGTPLSVELRRDLQVTFFGPQ